jgi:hypothetical protein
MPKYVLTAKPGVGQVRVDHPELPKDATLGPKAEGGARIVKVLEGHPVTIDATSKVAGEIEARYHASLLVAGVAPASAIPAPLPVTKAKSGK